MKKVLALISLPEMVNILLAVGLLFRLVLIPSPGFEADISFWKSWGLAIRDYGIVNGLPLTNFNYPTPFAYFLAGMAHVYSFFADPHNFAEYWSNTNLLFLAIAKAPSIIADFGIFAVILWIGKHAKRIGFPLFPFPFYVMLGFIYLLNPLPMFDGALWGQVDSLGVFLFLIACTLVFTKRPMLAGVVYMVAMMTKLQNMIYGPVFFLFIWQYLGLDGLVRAIAGAGGAFITLNMEFILARQFSRVAGDLTGNYDYFPWLSLNAYNVWWIVSGAKGMQISDKIASIGIVNAKTVGLYMFSSTYLLSILFMMSDTIRKMWHAKIGSRLSDEHNPVEQKTLIFRFVSALIIVAGAFFLFQTESHDRYAFPISIFLLLWGPFYLTLESKTGNTLENKLIQPFFVWYLVFTLLFFYNIHNAMLANYPNNGIPFLAFLNTPPLTIIASYAQIALYLFFLYVIRRHITMPLFGVWIGTFILLIVASNAPLLMGKPVPITKFTPVISTTGYGRRQINMPVNAGFGIQKWGFLSVQYGFYKYGIGSHAPARDVYDINRQFRTLSTDYGVDTNGGPQGSVQFSIYGDGKLLFASDVIKRFEFPRHIEVDITGVKTLELTINDGGNSNFDDHADWLNTFLIP